MEKLRVGGVVSFRDRLPAGYAERCCRSTFPGETFRVLKEKELRQFGEYRTRRLVLEAWEGEGARANSGANSHEKSASTSE